MDFLTRVIADGLMIPLAMLGVWAIISRTPRANLYDRYMRILMAGVTSYMLAKFVSVVWQPETMRPFEKLGIDPGATYLNNPGFPSDHALFAAFLTLAVWYATRRGLTTAVMAGLTLLVCIGRVMALVHTPLDVLGGVAVALCGGVWYLSATKHQVKTKVANSTKT